MFYKSLKNSIFACFATLILSTFSYAEIVKDIKINGSNRVSIDTIQIFSGVKIGDDLNVNETLSLGSDSLNI